VLASLSRGLKLHDDDDDDDEDEDEDDEDDEDRQSKKDNKINRMLLPFSAVTKEGVKEAWDLIGDVVKEAVRNRKGEVL